MVSDGYKNPEFLVTCPDAGLAVLSTSDCDRNLVCIITIHLKHG